jgi:GT2 family glycosyltransferase
MAKVGLVSVLYNSDNVLEGFIKSISLQTFTDYHLYLIDNTSNDKTDKYLTELISKYHIANITHVKNSNNEGVAKGNNQGIELSMLNGCKYTLLLNNDIEFDQPNLLHDLVERSEKKNENLIIPKILFFDNRKIWMAGGKMDFWLGVNSHIGYNCADEDIYNHEMYVSYAPTCFMLIANSVFKDVGYMDEQYFVYYDDTDFVYRAQKKGYKILYLPHLCLLHKVSSSTGGEDTQFAVYYLLRNRILFLRKNFHNIRFLFAILYCSLSSVYRYIKNAKYRKTIVSAFKDGATLKIKHL